MSKDLFSIPQDLFEDKTLTPTQKMILTFLRNNGANFSLNIAKGIGTRRSVIQDELNQLIKRKKAFASNGNQRVAYSLNPSFDLKRSPVKHPEKDVLCSLRSKELRKNKHPFEGETDYPNLQLTLEDKAQEAVYYWEKNGFKKHRLGTKIRAKGINRLKDLFSGKMFDIVPDTVIPNPLLNKTKIFDLEDWKTSIDNYLLSLTSPAHYPVNKEKSIAYQKKIALSDFIYNGFANEGRTRSFFLQYLDPPKLMHNEIALYKKLTTSLTKQFPKTNFRLKPIEPQIIAAANMYGAIIKEYEWKYDSPATAARVFIEFIEVQFGHRYNPQWMVTKWFKFELENYLDRQGLINITN